MMMMVVVVHHRVCFTSEPPPPTLTLTGAMFEKKKKKDTARGRQSRCCASTHTHTHARHEEERLGFMRPDQMTAASIEIHPVGHFPPHASWSVHHTAISRNTTNTLSLSVCDSLTTFALCEPTMDRSCSCSSVEPGPLPLTCSRRTSFRFSQSPHFSSCIGSSCAACIDCPDSALGRVKFP